MVDLTVHQLWEVGDIVSRLDLIPADEQYSVKYRARTIPL